MYSNPLPIFGENRLPKIFIAAFVCAALLLYALLATPLYDDGLAASFIIGTPYYSEYHELRFPFYKPLTTVLLPVRYLPHPWSFAAAALIHVLLMSAASYLTFLIARRYVQTKAASLAAFITLYALFTHESFMPTRPEPLLLLTILGVVFLSDTWRLMGRMRYLLMAAALTGALALPMHTNASIAYIYLALFALWQRKRLATLDWTRFIAVLGGSSLLGMIAILAPDPSELVELLTEYSEDKSRFTFFVGEMRRFTFFLRPYPLLPIMLFFGAVGLTVSVTRTLSNSTPPQSYVRKFARRYAGILIFGLAALIGLAFLPSAEWPHYLVYYVPSLSIFAALAYYQKRPRLRVTLAMTALVITAIALELIVLATLRDNLEAWIVTSLLFGMPIAALLGASWISGWRSLLIATLILGAIVRLGLMSADYHAYGHIAHTVRDRAVEAEAETIMGPPQLNWAFARDNFIAITHLSDDTPDVEFGLVALPQIWYRDRWLELASESCEFGQAEPIHLSSFVSNKLRETRWETMTIQCTQPSHPSITP